MDQIDVRNIKNDWIMIQLYIVIISILSDQEELMHWQVKFRDCRKQDLMYDY